MSNYLKDPLKAKQSVAERRQAIEQALAAGTSTTLIAARLGATAKEIEYVRKLVRQAKAKAGGSSSA